MTTQSVVRGQSGKHEIGMEDMDMSKFFFYSAGGILSMRFLIHPLSTMKTRLQMQEAGSQLYTGTGDAFRKTLRREGVRGLYRGIGANLFGILPAQTAYISTLEYTRSAVSPHIEFQPLRNLVAGGIASCASSLFGVPMDVISQRQMMQGTAGSTHQYKNVWHAVKSIFKAEGIKGLYRGYGATLVTYAPSSATWWGTYGLVKPIIWPFLEERSSSLMYIAPALCGMISAFCAALVTNPLDVAKTRLQVETRGTEVSGKRASNIFSTMLSIYRKEGLVKLWTKGLSARLGLMMFSSTLMSSAYEGLKRVSLKDELLVKEEVVMEEI
eukprot:TRINITY_DN1735_c1_g1_i1.p1 TRINITY_DN1735_c1_g1~~TRINITY_DN1735_c1_g1_i1.p1  ORF type:complete len:350 (+),score=47.72 TRINITY_DN1735_c1_g1_i1:73-1050(+)